VGLVGVDRLGAPQERVDRRPGLQQHVVRPQPFRHEQLVAVGRGVVLDVLHRLDRGVLQSDLLKVHVVRE
jgi:hypothetical protein